MKHKNKKVFIILILLFMCGLAIFLFSCTETETTPDDAGASLGVALDPKANVSSGADTRPAPAESNPPEPIEIFDSPILPADFVTANIQDISAGTLFDKNFRRGINMGNMLEAPEEGAWGVYFERRFFTVIKERGFDFIRLPVGWQYYAEVKNDGSVVIDKWFVSRVKHIIDEALQNDLGVIVNIHHFGDMDSYPEENAEKLYGIWRIISEQYQNYPANVIFEIFNEPHDRLDTKTWNQYQNECIKIIRETNPARKIVVSAGDWGGIGGIMDLILPEDENLILSFHYYDPFNFTHQGADWSMGPGGMDHALGTEWHGTDFEKRSVDNAFKGVKAWSEETGLPVFMGEFGAFSRADMESRARWTEYVRETAEYYGFAWSYWEFCAGFGIYDQESGQIFEELANALTGTPVNHDTYATGTGMPRVAAERNNGYIGPFTIERNINIVCDAWTGISLYDAENGTQIAEINAESTVDWGRAYIILDGLTDDGDGFSHDTAELTIRNIGGSITDLCINLDNNSPLETTLLWMNESQLKGNSREIIQNDDGTTTFILNLRRVYREFRGSGEDGFRLKIFIESVPDRSGNYDREGRIEFIKVELKQ